MYRSFKSLLIVWIKALPKELLDSFATYSVGGLFFNPSTTDEKPFTPTFDSDLKSIYAPNVDDYKKPPEDEEDEDDDDDTGDTTVDPCPPGYKMNPDTGVCEVVSAQRTARQDDPSDPPE